MAEEEAKPTIPTGLNYSLRGFESEEAARAFADLLQALLAAISRSIDLTRLDGVTVAYDYGEALAGLDRGMQGLAPLTATSELYATGVAMTPTVMRNGVPKSHMVLNAQVARAIEQEEMDLDVVYLIAHECGHVHDLRVRDEAFPGLILQKSYANIYDSLFKSISAACWDEFAACSLSAHLSAANTTPHLAEVFIEATREAQQKFRDRIKDYRVHADLNQLVAETGALYGNVLKYASYLLGHLHGLGQSLDDCPSVLEFLQDHWSASYILRLDQTLRLLMSRCGEWADISEFDEIVLIADDLFSDEGIEITKSTDTDCYINVPFSFETMPDA